MSTTVLNRESSQPWIEVPLTLIFCAVWMLYFVSQFKFPIWSLRSLVKVCFDFLSHTSNFEFRCYSNFAWGGNLIFFIATTIISNKKSGSFEGTGLQQEYEKHAGGETLARFQGVVFVSRDLSSQHAADADNKSREYSPFWQINWLMTCRDLRGNGFVEQLSINRDLRFPFCFFISVLQIQY